MFMKLLYKGMLLLPTCLIFHKILVCRTAQDSLQQNGVQNSLHIRKY